MKTEQSNTQTSTQSVVEASTDAPHVPTHQPSSTPCSPSHPKITSTSSPLIPDLILYLIASTMASFAFSILRSFSSSASWHAAGVSNRNR